MIWIRSQDKECLLTVTSIWLGSTSTETRTLQAETEVGGSWIIGSFLNHDAALAELNKIEKWIRQGAEGVYTVNSG